MKTTANTRIQLASGAFFFLQSLFNETDPLTEDALPDGDNYYVGYPCTDAPQSEHPPVALSGHQPGQCYPATGIASTDNAASDISSI